MKRAKIGELKNSLSKYLESVRRGETVLVLDRKTPIAKIVPVGPPVKPGGDETDLWLRRLEQEGLIRLGTRRAVPEILEAPPPGRQPAGAVQALIEERRRR